MTCIRMLLVGLILAASIATADYPPPFGTVIQQWEVPDSLGGGITWRRDSERFYVMGSGGRDIWSATATDPTGTLRRENWESPNMGMGTVDIPWDLAWDNDSGCFWFSNIVDGNIYGGCYYVRIRKSPTGDTWRWFSQNPGDTWLVGDGSAGGGGNMYWLAGSEKWLNRDYFVGAPVAPSPSTDNHVWRFDPYTKADLGRLPDGSTVSERGITLVPWDSNYIITTSWNASYTYRMCKRDSAGLPLESVPVGPIDIALWVPRVIYPEDTVSFYGICSTPNRTLQRISVGLLWSQLPGSQAVAEPSWPAPAANDLLRIEPNPCRGSATLSFTGPLDHSTTGPLSLSLVDASGRLVLESPFAIRHSPFALNLRSLPAGVYVLRLSAGTSSYSEKVVLQH